MSFSEAVGSGLARKSWYTRANDWRASRLRADSGRRYAQCLLVLARFCFSYSAFSIRELDSGAACKTTWALVPPKPNELTPARAGPDSTGHGPSAVCTRRGI